MQTSPVLPFFPFKKIRRGSPVPVPSFVLVVGCGEKVFAEKTRQMRRSIHRGKDGAEMKMTEIGRIPADMVRLWKVDNDKVVLLNHEFATEGGPGLCGYLFDLDDLPNEQVSHEDLVRDGIVPGDRPRHRRRLHVSEVIIEEVEGGYVHAALYEWCDVLEWKRFALVDLPNDLISAADLERHGIVGCKDAPSVGETVLDRAAAHSDPAL